MVERVRYSKGDILRVVANNTAHQFEIGTMVRIKKCLDSAYGIDEQLYVAEYLDGHDHWQVNDDDLEEDKPDLEGIPLSIDRVDQAMKAFEGSDDKYAQLTDMLTDLMHWSDENELVFEDHLHTAGIHYYAEKEEAETLFKSTKEKEA